MMMDDIFEELISEGAPVYATLMYQYWDITQLTSYIYMGSYPPAKFFEKQGAAGVPELVRMTNRVLWVGR